mgnify:CR=1 FL=1
MPVNQGRDQEHQDKNIAESPYPPDVLARLSFMGFLGRPRTVYIISTGQRGLLLDK